MRRQRMLRVVHPNGHEIPVGREDADPAGEPPQIASVSSVPVELGNVNLMEWNPGQLMPGKYGPLRLAEDRELSEGCPLSRAKVPIPLSRLHARPIWDSFTRIPRQLTTRRCGTHWISFARTTPQIGPALPVLRRWEQAALLYHL